MSKKERFTLVHGGFFLKQKTNLSGTVEAIHHAPIIHEGRETVTCGNTLQNTTPKALERSAAPPRPPSPPFVETVAPLLQIKFMCVQQHMQHTATHSNIPQHNTPNAAKSCAEPTHPPLAAQVRTTQQTIHGNALPHTATNHTQSTQIEDFLPPPLLQFKLVQQVQQGSPSHRGTEFLEKVLQPVGDPSLSISDAFQTEPYSMESRDLLIIKGAQVTAKRAVCNVTRALFNVKRAVYIHTKRLLKRPTCTQKALFYVERALFYVKRAVYIHAERSHKRPTCMQRDHKKAQLYAKRP